MTEGQQTVSECDEPNGMERAIEDALEDIEQASEEIGPEGLPMLNQHIITARHRLEDALDGEYPWDADTNETERSETTHYKWLCGRCGSVVWLPVETHGPQVDHDEHPFCGCQDQGIRMTRMHGKEGEVSL